MQVFGPTLVATQGNELVSEVIIAFVKFTTFLGPHHRKQRKLLNPLFNVNHMRHMTPIFHGVTRKVLLDLAYTNNWHWSQPS
jgi:cytochrome P450